MGLHSKTPGKHDSGTKKPITEDYGTDEIDIFEGLVNEKRTAKDGIVRSSYRDIAEQEPMHEPTEELDEYEYEEPEEYYEDDVPQFGMSVLSIVLGGCIAAVILCFALFLYRLDILPLGLYIGAVAAMVLFGVLAVVLTSKKGRTVRTVIGVFLAVVLIGGLGYGCFLLNEAWDTAQKVTTVEPMTTVVGVYVQAADPVQSIDETSDYLFGILKESDREDTNQALQMIANDLGKAISVAEFNTVTDLVYALGQGSVNAAVFESYHVEMLRSMETEEYTALVDAIRELRGYTVEKKSVNAGMESIGVSPIHKQEKPEEPEESHVISLYITGIDTYGTVNVQSRSDVNIMAFINTETHQILLVTTPRDYYVYTPVSGEYKDKLTHAGLWGPECSMGALEYLYDCNLDYYFRLNFSGFVNIIDALGGIDFAYNEGDTPRHLGGADALTIARDRTLCGSDYNRGLNQLKIIKAVINKALSSDMLYNFTDVMAAVEGSFETTVPYDMITDNVKKQLSENPSWEILSYGVSGTGASEIPYAFRVYGNETGMYAYVCEPDYSTVDLVKSLIVSMKNDEVISIPAA